MMSSAKHSIYLVYIFPEKCVDIKLVFPAPMVENFQKGETYPYKTNYELNEISDPCLPVSWRKHFIVLSLKSSCYFKNGTEMMHVIFTL
jgi:hypothetical protein